jgi:hypothetical protein
MRISETFTVSSISESFSGHENRHGYKKALQASSSLRHHKVEQKVSALATKTVKIVMPDHPAAGSLAAHFCYRLT